MSKIPKGNLFISIDSFNESERNEATINFFDLSI